MGNTAFKAIAAASALLMAPEGASAAAVIVQAGDPGVSQGGATPNSNAAAASFYSSNPSTFTETFEDAAATGFTIAGGTITATPLGSGSSVFGFNTTPGGRYVLELYGASSTLTFASAISSFGFYLTGVQFGNLTLNFNDGSSQTVAITNYGSGVQFFGASGFSNAITGFTLNAGNDIVGVDDIRFASVSGVPEPTTWAMMLIGFGAIGATMRRRRRVTAVAQLA